MQWTVPTRGPRTGQGAAAPKAAGCRVAARRLKEQILDRVQMVLGEGGKIESWDKKTPTPRNDCAAKMPAPKMRQAEPSRRKAKKSSGGPHPSWEGGLSMALRPRKKKRTPSLSKTGKDSARPGACLRSGGPAGQVPWAQLALPGSPGPSRSHRRLQGQRELSSAQGHSLNPGWGRSLCPSGCGRNEAQFCPAWRTPTDLGGLRSFVASIYCPCKTAGSPSPLQTG